MSRNAAAETFGTGCEALSLSGWKDALKRWPRAKKEKRTQHPTQICLNAPPLQGSCHPFISPFHMKFFVVVAIGLCFSCNVFRL